MTQWQIGLLFGVAFVVTYLLVTIVNALQDISRQIRLLHDDLRHDIGTLGQRVDDLGDRLS